MIFPARHRLSLWRKLTRWTDQYHPRFMLAPSIIVKIDAAVPQRLIEVVQHALPAGIRRDAGDGAAVAGLMIR